VFKFLVTTIGPIWVHSKHSPEQGNIDKRFDFRDLSLKAFGHQG